MSDLHDLRDLKREQQSLLDLNRRHRLEAIGKYVKIISKIEKKVGRKR